MERLPLYPNPDLPVSRGGLRVPLELERPRDRNPGCRLCRLATLRPNKSVCMAAQATAPEPGGVWLVGQHPGAEEDARGVPHAAASGAWLRELAARWANGRPLVFDNAVRCAPPLFDDRQEAAKVLQPAVSACRPYLSAVWRSARPSRIVALGELAALAILGRSVDPLDVRKGFAWLVGKGCAPCGGTGLREALACEACGGAGRIEQTPVFLVMAPGSAARNRFLKRWFAEDLEWAMTAEPPFSSPVRATVRLPSTPAEAERAAAELRAAPWFSFDAEWFGALHTPDFRVLAISAASATAPDDAFVWDHAAVADPAVLTPLLALLRDPRVKKRGFNVKEDAKVVEETWGGTVRGVDGDARLWRKQLESDASGYLEDVAELVGMGGLKKEAQEEMAAAVAEVKARWAREDAGRGEQLGLLGGPREFQMRPDLAAMRRGVEAQDDADGRYAYALLPLDVFRRYSGRDAVAHARTALLLGARVEANPIASRHWRRLLLPTSEAMRRVERWGMPVDAEALRALQGYLAARLDEVRPRFAAYGHLFENGVNLEPGANLNAFLTKLLFGHLGLKSKYVTEKGNPTTSAAALKKIRDQHPIVADAVRWSEISTMWKDVRRLLQHVRADGRIHSTIDLAGARSGRTSSADPPLQNITSEEREFIDGEKLGKILKDCFRAPDGWTWWSADYKQLEFVIGADESGDPVMLECFHRGEDIHWYATRLVCKAMWGVAPELATKGHRKMVKPIDFGLFFGMSDETLAENAGMPLADAEKIHRLILGKWVRCAAWIEERKEEARRRGVAQVNWLGEPAYLRQLWGIAGHDGGARGTAERSSYNTPIQGRANYYCQKAVALVVGDVVEDGMPAEVNMPIHDQLLGLCPEEAVDEVLGRVRERMEGQPTNTGVPLRVDAAFGKTWGSLETWKG